ncbi:MAG TPA: 2-C-methyl-D-erythritol 2,4-cyclodiphosphate synthase [Candidatus Dormibacteraeota bacterium]|nr:2-C-methyl-D-erythritol 2,4-cyclodiphosphate synthase [Candidatus Dormibacteraeota bacterium]
MRVGIGYDIHPLIEGRPLVLGGVVVPHPRGLRGHSDADVLVHALIDAMLGAAALGTIGGHFPDGDPRFAGVSSLLLLDEARRLVEGAGYRVVNVDTVIIAQEPRLQPHLEPMARTLAGHLGLDVRRVGVKATSPEGLGALGRLEGIAAQAVVLLEDRSEGREGRPHDRGTAPGRSDVAHELPR